MSELALIVGPDRSVSLAGEFIELRERALEESALIGKIEDPDDNAEVTRAMRSLKVWRDAVESARKKTKEPFLDMGRKIDARAKEFCADVDEELLRLSNIAIEYQTEQRREAARREAARRDELDRIEREKRAAIIEAARQPDATPERLAAIEERAEQEAEAAGPPVEAPKAKGQVVKPDWDFEVTDIWKLLREHPTLCNVEPRRADILLQVRAGRRELAGCRIFETMKVTTRAGRAIDV